VHVLQHLHPYMSPPQGLIVGAGPCGLAAAFVLRKNGITVRLIEKALDYQISVCGNGIQVNAMDLRDTLIFANALLQPRILELFKILVADIFDNSIEPPHMRACDGKPVIRTWDFGVKEPVEQIRNHSLLDGMRCWALEI